MSLVRIAARISAVEALKGRTLVGDNVLDSEIGAIDIGADGSARTDEDRPFIAVYTDAGAASDIALRSLLVNGPTELLFESGITAAMTETDPNTDESRIIGIGIPATDKAFEFYLDMIARQIGDALTDPANEWGQIFMGLSHKLTSVKRARTSGDGNGQRLAGQQISITADLWPDPVKGKPMADTHPLALFLTKADTVPALDTEIALMRAAVAGTVTDYDIMRQRFGRTVSEGEASGAGIHPAVAPIVVAPEPEEPDEEPPEEPPPDEEPLPDEETP